jgi:hypothetical protein
MHGISLRRIFGRARPCWTIGQQLLELVTLEIGPRNHEVFGLRPARHLRGD